MGGVGAALRGGVEGGSRAAVEGQLEVAHRHLRRVQYPRGDLPRLFIELHVERELGCSTRRPESAASSLTCGGFDCSRRRRLPVPFPRRLPDQRRSRLDRADP